MAKAYVEWDDGTTSDLDAYEAYLINTGPVKVELGIEELRVLNVKMGFPDLNGAML